MFCLLLNVFPYPEILTTNLLTLSLPLYQEDCLEKVINDTECLFKSREKEYQETIDQIEVRHLLCIFSYILNHVLLYVACALVIFMLCALYLFSSA